MRGSRTYGSGREAALGLATLVLLVRRICTLLGKPSRFCFFAKSGPVQTPTPRPW
jgi:hypothetical protein